MIRLKLKLENITTFAHIQKKKREKLEKNLAKYHNSDHIAVKKKRKKVAMDRHVIDGPEKIDVSF